VHYTDVKNPEKQRWYLLPNVLSLAVWKFKMLKFNFYLYFFSPSDLGAWPFFSFSPSVEYG
jgi:hypothetical protein